MRIRFPIILRAGLIALVWAVAGAVFVWDFASGVGRIAAALGAIAGFLAAGLVGLQPRRMATGATAALATSILLPGIVAWLPLSLGWTFAVTEVFDLGLKAGVAALVLNWLSRRWRWFSGVDALLIGLALASALAAHRFGHVTRPYWVMDRWIEMGHNPGTLLWVAGAVAASLVALLLLADSGNSPTWKVWIAGVILASAAVGLTRIAPPLAFEAPSEPPPPRVQTPDPPPPPPPPSKPLALVQFGRLTKPPARLGAYYFRTEARSDWENGAASADASEAVIDDAALRVLHQADSNAIVNTHVACLVKTNLVFALIPTAAIGQPVAMGKPYVESYEIVSTKLDSGAVPDLDLSTFRQELTSPLWSPEQTNRYLSVPADTNIAALVQDILAAIPDELGAYLPPRVKCIRRWLNENIALSCNVGASNPPPTITEFLFTRRVGGYEQFARAAVCLFRQARVPSRLGRGYVVGVAEGEVPSQVLVTDAHAQAWPEVYLRGTGWLPVPLNPTNVLDRPNPPPEPELEQMLEQQSRAPTPEPPHRNASMLPVGALILLVPLVLATAWGAWVRGLCLRCCPSAHLHEEGLACAFRLCASAGLFRVPTETYEEFALRVKRELGAANVAYADALMEVVRFHGRTYLSGPPQSRKAAEAKADWIRLNKRMNRSLTRWHMQRTWRLKWLWRTAA